jgi:excisionase family DNA binding protein
MTDGSFLSARQVAEQLGIRVHGVLSLLKSGELRAIDVSLRPGGRRRWRISSSDLDAFILRRTHRPAPPRRRRHKSTNVKAYF